MSAPVDVLAVMDWHIREASARKSKSVTGAAALREDVSRLTEARAAIAELIEAADRVWSNGGAVPGSDWDALGNALAAVSPK